MNKKIRVAAMQYALQSFNAWQEYVHHYTHLVEQIKSQEVDLLLLPEYAGLELTDMTRGVETVFAQIQTHLEDYIALFAQLAMRHHIYIVPGTLPVALDNGQFVNRAYFFTPQGEYFFQDKIMLTPDEKNVQLLQAGDEIKVFDTRFGKMGIAICYDSEFPSLVQQMTLRGAQIILVPSCTDTMTGFYRVHLSCRARALENQCYVVNAYLIRQGPWCGEMSEHVGAAGVFTPVDQDFPQDGILSLGEMSQPQAVVEELDLAKISFVREHGDVRNFHDMQALGLHRALRG